MAGEEHELHRLRSGSRSRGRGRGRGFMRPRNENDEEDDKDVDDDGEDGSPPLAASEARTGRRRRSSAMPSDIVDEELQRRTVRKLDFILLPFLALLFLFNSLDKSNIGNAETANFTTDIGLQKGDLNDAVAVFFAFFVALQPVGAALGRRYGMSMWVPGCMSLWGLCTMLHVWVRSKWQLVLLRMIIGSLEAGFYPVTVSYLSLFYTKFEFGRRLAIFYGQSAIAGAFGGILSYVVFSRFPSEARVGPDDKGWRSWQVLFFIEGSITICLALVGFVWLPHSAKTAWFLNHDERVWAEERIRADQMQQEIRKDRGRPGLNGRTRSQQNRHSPDAEVEGLLRPSSAEPWMSKQQRNVITDDRGLSRQDLLSAFVDWKVWYLLLCNILSSIPVTAFSVFLPLVLAPLTNPSMFASDEVNPDHHSNAALTNLLTAPPFLLGGIVLFAFTSYSDRHRIRLAPILAGLSILLLGLTLVIFLPTTWVVPRYFSLCVLLSGSFVASPLQVAWLSNNIPQPAKRSVVMGINGWGNLAGVISAQLFKPKFAPSYKIPFFITFGAVSSAWMGYALFRTWLVHENRLREHENHDRAKRQRDGPVELVLQNFGFERARHWVADIRAAEREYEGPGFTYGL